MLGSNLIQFLTYASLMATSIFIPLMAVGFGATPGTIGFLVGIFNLFYLVSSSLFGVISDRFGGKYVLRGGLLLSALCFTLLIFSHDIFSLFIARSLGGFAAGIFPSALAVYAYSEHAGKMGKFAGFGALGWALGALITGFVASTNMIFFAGALFFSLAFIFSLGMEEHFHLPKESNLFPFDVFKRNLRIYIPYFFRALGAQAIWAIFPLYLVMTGADRLWVGVAYFINAFSQFFITRYIEKYRNLQLINTGLLFSVVTFLGYALFPYIGAVLFFQFLLAFSYATLQVGALQELLSKNVEQSTAMGLLNSIINFTAVIGPFIAGAIAECCGYRGVMWGAVVISFIGLVSFTTVLE